MRLRVGGSKTALRECCLWEGPNRDMKHVLIWPRKPGFHFYRLRQDAGPPLQDTSHYCCSDREKEDEEENNKLYWESGCEPSGTGISIDG